MEVSEESEAGDQQQGEDQVHDDLFGVEALRWQLGLDGVFLDGSGCAGLAEQVDMHRDEGKEDGREHDDVHEIEAGERERTDSVAASHHVGHPLANHRDGGNDVGGYGGGEVRLLVPGQQVAGKAHGEDEDGEYAARGPEELTASFRGSR